ISYHTADRAWGDWIAWQLEEAGYSTMRQDCQLVGGPDFVARAVFGAMHSARTMVLLSPDYLPPEMTPEEWKAAFARDPAGDLGLLVPVRVRVCDTRGFVLPNASVELAGLNKIEAVERLLEAAGGRRPKARPPAAPGQIAVPLMESQPPFPG